MRLLRLLAVISVILISVKSANACERLPIDPEFPAGLKGSYEVIGKDPTTGDSYVGRLALAYGKTNYALTRTIQGAVIHGDAWMEQCGVDKIQFLVARYYTQPVMELSCRLGADGDNYYRVTCRTRRIGLHGQGLEAWFQQQ